MKKLIVTIVSILVLASSAWADKLPYTIVDTGQEACFGNTRQTSCPDKGDVFFGQDGQYRGNQPKYHDNGDGTISDLNTGLMWVKARGDMETWTSAMRGASECRVGGYDDWRAPTIKELYSLIDFNGWVQMSEKTSRPFIDTRYFDFKFGDTSKGERIIDCQDWSSTEYVAKTMGGNKTVFGVNFADGRIKGYGKSDPRRGATRKYIRYVRGNPNYGKNDFVDNKNGTVTDQATGLTWQKKDDGKTYNWEQALAYCENMQLAGRSDWRLPNIKELQSLTDYSRSPTTTNSAAIDPVFPMSNKESYFYSSTTHLDGPKPDHASYVAFGRAMGYFQTPRSSSKKFMDVHGAGAQRSDPKSGNPDRYSQGHGPQGDDIRIYNYVRCVTGGGVEYYDPPNKSVGRFSGGPNSGQSGMGRPSSGNQRRQDSNMHQGQQMMGGQGMPQGQMGGQGMRQGGPPQEAFDACDGAYQGDDCSFNAPHGTVSGVCRDMGGGSVCVPDHGPGGGPPMQ